MTTVKKFMTSDVACCTADQSLEEAAKLMVKYNCGEIPVVDNHQSKHVQGVITDRDICCRSLGVGKNPMTLKVSDCMSSPVITVSEDASARDCLHLMEKNKIRRLPVIDKNGACCGMVSQGDIALALGKREAGELVQEISKQGESPSSISIQ